VARGWAKSQGHPEQMCDGRPVIGICNTWSDLNPCNAHLRILAEQVKRGVYEAGGFPLEFPVTSLGETMMKPTTMLYRNLASMDVEESMRANPIDGVVLLTSCDKTTPACLMGAASVDMPTMVVTGGPMLNGKFRNRDIGSGTDVHRFTTELRAGTISQLDYLEAEAGISRSDGHCMTMGTASTMACMVEALGLTLPSGAAIPGPDARRKRLGHLAGNRIVEMVSEELCMSKILTRQAVENAIKVNAVLGGSTRRIMPGRRPPSSKRPGPRKNSVPKPIALGRWRVMAWARHTKSWAKKPWRKSSSASPSGSIPPLSKPTTTTSIY
jgi:dihydroxy-acid dehydratase